MGPPVLLSGPNVDYSNGAAVTYTFNREVTASPLDNSSSTEGSNSTGGSRWSVVSPAPSGTVRVKYTGADEEPVRLGLRAEAAYNGVTKSKDVPAVTVMPVTAAFERPSPTMEYSLVYYDTANSVVRLKPAGSSSTSWYYVKAADTPLRDLFKGIYSPNAPGTTDSVEAGKQAVSYTGETSRAALALFRITLDSDSPAKVEIRGELPAPGGADKYHPLVIDIGIPDIDNQGFPVFQIPNRGLGTAGVDYAYIRFRVNRGMELDIASGDTKGNIKNGTVEVMGNGRLRDRAYEGFLGSGSVVIVRLGGYLGVGPKSLFESEGYDDWLIGPAGKDGKISWGTGDQNGSYIELREDGKMAFSADITVRKSLALNYNVWFVNGPILRIDTAGDPSTVDGLKGLFAGAGGYRFYGDYFNSGGQNPSRVEANVIVQPGNQISRSLFAGGEGYIIGPASIPNRGAGNTSATEYGRDSIKGYPNWNIP
jgi:hypothetical protein